MPSIGSKTDQEERLLDLLLSYEDNAIADHANLHIRSLPGAGSSIAYFEFGDPDGRPMLCLHGLSLTGLYFAQYDSHFAQLGIRAIAPCMMGGIYLPDPKKTIDILTTELLELLDILGVGKFDVMGFSWGTLAQLALLARVPERIGKAGIFGAMLPLAFMEAAHIAQLKADVRVTLGMVRRMPFVHCCLMALVCSMPIAKLVEQFKDENMSAQERDTLKPGTPFYAFFTRCMKECMHTGSRFFTLGWRMFLDKPGYALRDLAPAAAKVDVRLYVADLDNVHLPYCSAQVAAAITGANADDVSARMAPPLGPSTESANEVFARVYSEKKCSVWMMRGAGRLACVVNFKDALNNLMAAA